MVMMVVVAVVTLGMTMIGMIYRPSSNNHACCRALDSSSFAKLHAPLPLALPWMKQCLPPRRCRLLLASSGTGGCLRWALKRRFAALSLAS
jgi:hypothetical protein